jgi:hypothetical protein
MTKDELVSCDVKETWRRIATKHYSIGPKGPEGLKQMELLERGPGNTPSPEKLRLEIIEWRKQVRDPTGRSNMLNDMLAALLHVFGTEKNQDTLEDITSMIKSDWESAKFDKPPRSSEIKRIYNNWRHQGVIKLNRAGFLKDNRFSDTQVKNGTIVVTDIAFGSGEGLLPD